MNGFPDLTGAQTDTDHDDSFWPSFTDIMMVVVMIFLITTAIQVTRNMELIRQLTQTTESEQQAKQQAQVTLAENLTLEERVAALEDLLSASQLRQMRTQEEKAQLQNRVEKLVADLARKTNLSTNLENRLKAKTREIETTVIKLAKLDKELQQAKEALEQKSRELMAKLAKLETASTTIDALLKKQEQSEVDYANLKMKAELSDEELQKIQDEYRELEGKYTKLVRPARTTKGKYVVSLRYEKNEGSDQFELKTPESGTFKAYTEQQMHNKLQALKDQYKNDLYIRIIFPENNQLSYKEAWSFTREILDKYDYYNQATE